MKRLVAELLGSLIAVAVCWYAGRIIDRRTLL